MFITIKDLKGFDFSKKYLILDSHVKIDRNECFEQMTNKTEKGGKKGSISTAIERKDLRQTTVSLNSFRGPAQYVQMVCTICAECLHTAYEALGASE